MSSRSLLIAAGGVIVGIILALCFFRVAAAAFHLVSFFVWIGIGIIIVAAVYTFLMRQWRGS